MSAFIVTDAHIDALLTAGLAYTSPGSPLTWPVPSTTPPGEERLTDATADRVGAMLLEANERGVNALYNSTAKETPWTEQYRFHRLSGKASPLLVLKAISCLEYQSCDAPDWNLSEAFMFCAALRTRAVNRLPGFDDAPGWSLTTSRTIFLTSESRPR